MRLRLLLAGLGVLVGAYGAFLLLSRQDSDQLVNAAIWLAFGVVLHDLVLAPVVLGLVVAGARIAPVAARVPAATALVVLGAVDAPRGPRARPLRRAPGQRHAARSRLHGGLVRARRPRPPRHRGGHARTLATAAGKVTVARVLVVDDDPTVREVVVSYLRAHEHEVVEAEDGETALARQREEPHDLVVLDLMLPGIDGIEVCRQLRQDGDVPIIMLTALGEETDRVVGLEVGADDYVTKPFSPRELALRVDSVLRRTRTPLTPKRLVDGDLVVDEARHEAYRSGEVMALTGREFDLLCFLLAHPGTAYSREELLEHVWGWTFGDQSTVTVHVRRLREKVEADPTRPVRLCTVWGVGYRWEAAS